MIPLLESPAAQRLAWTLLHFLWQGALLGLSAWGALALLRRRRPQLRYLVGCAFLLACLGSAIATFALLSPPVPAVPAPSDIAQIMPMPVLAQGHLVLEDPSPRATPVALPWQARLQPFLPWILAAWAAGVLFLSLRAAGGWLWLRRLKALGTPITEPEWLGRLVRKAGLRRAVRFLESARVMTPMCMGLLRPVILLPLGFFANLDPLAAEAVLAHELAHLRRLDGLVNGLQCVVEVLFFFHPAVWWISRRIRTEREHCCDDAAVLACGDAIFYAETLRRLDALRDRPPSLALSARGGNLMERLRRLLLADPPQLRFATPSLTLVVALALIGTLPAQAEKPVTKPQAEETIPVSEDSPAPSERIETPTPGDTPGPERIPNQESPLPVVPGSVTATPAPTPGSTPAPASVTVTPPATPIANTLHPSTPVQGSAAPAPTPAPVPALPTPPIPVFQAKDLDIVPGLAIRTLKVPRYPAVIVDELLTWPNKGYAVDVPAHTTASLRVTCESGEAYFRVGVADKWGNPLPGIKGSQGVPWASFTNGSDHPVSVCFFVWTTKNYPGDGKIQLHLTRGGAVRNASDQEGVTATKTQGGLPVLKGSQLPTAKGPGLGAMLLPTYTAIIEDEIPDLRVNWYSALVPPHTTLKLQAQSDAGGAYLRLKPTAFTGLSNLRQPYRGYPECTVTNDGAREQAITFYLEFDSKYPGSRRIALHQTFTPLAPGADAQAPVAPSPNPPTQERAVSFRDGEPTSEEAQRILQAYADTHPWGDRVDRAVQGVRIGRKERWNGAYLDRWPRKPGKPPLFQFVGSVEGWMVTFQIHDQYGGPRTNQTMAVLLDKDGVIHWRKAWPALPPGLNLMESNLQTGPKRY